jgi:hypothetical protein
VITINRQIISRRCEPCNVAFDVVRGSVFEDKHPLGLYVLALHGHSPRGRLAHLAVGVLDRRDPEAAPVAIALEVSATEGQFRQSVVEWAESPLAGETHLGRMLDKTEALASPLKPVAFQIADHLLREISEARSYFAQPK